MSLVEEPYDKKKRKQPMTHAQLAQLYAKQPRVDYDSDDEPVRCGTPQHVRHARAAAVEALALPIGAPTSVIRFDGAQYSPTRNDGEWKRELEAALAAQRDNTRARRPSNRDLFGDMETEDGDVTDDDLYDDTYDPDRVVADPFYPDLTCTAAERDACLGDEQARRYESGLPLLVQDPTDPEHWIEPPLVTEPVFKDTDEYSVSFDLPALQATPVADIVCSPVSASPPS